jgi:hypothetical protein
MGYHVPGPTFECQGDHLILQLDGPILFNIVDILSYFERICK